MSEPEPDARGPMRLIAILQRGCVVAVLIAVALRLPAVEMGCYGGAAFTLFGAWYGKLPLVGMLLGS